jgi:hypothetical protein
MTHLGMMCLYAACLGAVFAALLRDDPKAQLRLGAQVFGALVVGAYAAGWLMFLAFH